MIQAFDSRANREDPMRKSIIAVVMLAAASFAASANAQTVKAAQMFEALTIDLDKTCVVGESGYECLVRSYTIARFYEAASVLCSKEPASVDVQKVCQRFFSAQDS